MRFILAVVVTLLLSCRSSKPAEKSSQRIPDTTKSAAGVSESKPNVIAPNVTRVEAVVERITIESNYQFSVTVFVVKADPVVGRYSIVEPQQRVTLQPEFHVSGPSGSVDMEAPRNKKLLSLRDAQVGHSFTGKIAIDQKGIWRLLEVEIQ